MAAHCHGVVRLHHSLNGPSPRLEVKKWMPTSLLNEIRDARTLEQALGYALYAQERDAYTDFFELDYVRVHKTGIVDELQEELATPGTYQQRPAYAYFMPKSNLGVRRMIHLNFKDLVLRYAFATVFGRILDPTLDETCFANRLAFGRSRTRIPAGQLCQGKLAQLLPVAA